MDWKLELVVVPVSDVDRAKAFYSEKLGFNVDVDHRIDDKNRVVQLTPPGSACSIAIGNGVSDVPPGSLQGLQLVVTDIRAAHDELVRRGVDVGDIQVRDKMATSWVTWSQPGRPPDWGSFVFFKDPDGNGWSVQQGPEGS
jgi:catechol 2,3-dioxygenase-like lactoylglutathione lyase family enzyme